MRLKEGFSHYGISNPDILNLEKKHGIALSKTSIDLRRSLIIGLLVNISAYSADINTVIADHLDVQIKVSADEGLAMIKAIVAHLEAIYDFTGFQNKGNI